jgi:hypothetical protein
MKIYDMNQDQLRNAMNEHVAEMRAHGESMETIATWVRIYLRMPQMQVLRG